MEKLVIFDFSTSTVHFYNVSREQPIDEEYIEHLGYDCNEVHWMAGDLEIIHHKGVLT